ncbi:carbohydrate esterase family 4 protein [Pisolithus sp. B1]|nr:carbohydrate esterase family 4 protein [Pisolithus sp. B1]
MVPALQTTCIAFASPSALLILIRALVFLSPAVAQDRTTEEGEAQITDPNVECTPYTYPPVSQAANHIQGQIPDISPKGTQPESLAGDFSDYSYPSDDPDCWWTSSTCDTPKTAGIPSDITTVPEPDTLGYGFDDGPNCSHNVFYDFLQSKDQTATMFYIGSNKAQRAIADGHQVCVHTWSHQYMTAMTNEEAFAELYYSEISMEMMKLVIGVTPTCWRPPYGDVDDRIRAIAQAMGLQTIVWQYDSSDWLGDPTTTNENYQDLINAAMNGTFNGVGTIILTHELTNFTMSEAIMWYSNLTSVFKHLVPVGVALNITKPYTEDGYTLPTFAQYVNGTHTATIAGSTSGTNSSNSTSTASHRPSSTSTEGRNSAQILPINSVGWLVVTAVLVGGALSV